MKKTIKDHILDLSKQYPGQLFSSIEIASKIADIADVEEKSVKKVLAKLTQVVGQNPWIIRQPGQLYYFSAIAATPKKKRKPTPKMKGRTFVAIVRDHSGSMSSIRQSARNDYNATIDNLKKNSKLSKTTLTVVECGSDTRYSTTNGVSVVEKNNAIESVQHIDYYHTPGDTPLLDSIGEAINQLKAIPDVKPIDAFMVIVITDGEENSSRRWNVIKLTHEIMRLQDTNQWTFAFRVPRGHSRYVTSMGVPAENIVEWETTNEGMAHSGIVTMNAMDSYYQDRSVGVTRSLRFFADTDNLNTKVLNQNLVDISKELQLLQVRVGDSQVIRDFFNARVGEYRAGCGFYQLVKNEKVQSYKKIVIHDKKSGAAYSGTAARQMLGLPATGDIKVAPGSFSQYNIYVQSTSVNRLLPLSTLVLYWKNAI